MTNEPNNLDAQVVSTALAVTNAVDSMANDPTSVKTKKNIVVDNKPADLGDRLEKGLKDLGAKFDKNIKVLGDRFDKNIKALGLLMISSLEKQSFKENKSIQKIEKNNVKTEDSDKKNKSIKKIEENNFNTKEDPVKKNNNTNKVDNYNNIERTINKLIPLKENIKESESDEKLKWQRISKIIGETIGIGKYAVLPEAQRLDSLGMNSKVKNAILPSNQITKDNKSKKDEDDEDDKDSISTIIKKISSALKTVFKVLGTFATGLIKIGKKIGKNIFNIIKRISSTIIKQLGKVTKKIANVFTSFKNIFKNIINDIGTTAGKLLSKLNPFKSEVPKLSVEKVKNAALPSASSSSTTLPKTAVAAPQTWFQKVTGKAVNVAKAGVSKVTALAKAGVSKVKGIAIEPVIKALKGLYTTVGGAKGILKVVGKTLNNPIVKKLPIAGPLLEIFSGRGDIINLKKQRENNEIKTDEELYRLAGERVIKGVGGLLTGTAGAVLLSGLPVIGTMAGGITGDILGRIGADAVTKYLIPNEATINIGRIVAGGELKQEEMQDFLVKDNSVYKFNKKDEILGMKDGGAVGQLLSSNAQNNDKQLFISSKQVSILEQIRDGIIALTKSRSSDSSVTNIHSNSNNTKSIPPQNFLRSDFNIAHNLQPI